MSNDASKGVWDLFGNCIQGILELQFQDWDFGVGILEDFREGFWDGGFGAGILELEFGTEIWDLEIWGLNLGVRNFGAGILGLEFWGWDFRIGILEKDFRIRILGLGFWLHALQVPGKPPQKNPKNSPPQGLRCCLIPTQG